jgi:hypothetical protein
MVELSRWCKYRPECHFDGCKACFAIPRKHGLLERERDGVVRSLFDDDRESGVVQFCMYGNWNVQIEFDAKVHGCDVTKRAQDRDERVVVGPGSIVEIHSIPHTDLYV